MRYDLFPRVTHTPAGDVLWHPPSRIFDGAKLLGVHAARERRRARLKHVARVLAAVGLLTLGFALGRGWL